MNPSFIHLRVHSTYSLLEGAIYIKELVGWCQEHDMPAVAVTDNGNLFGSLEFAMAAAKAGVQPIMGCVLQLKPVLSENNRPSHSQKPDQMLAYAQSETGWKNLLKLVSKAYLDSVSENGTPLLAYEDLFTHHEGLIILSGGIHGGITRALLAGKMDIAVQATNVCKRIFADRFYIEISRHGMPEEQQVEAALIELAYTHNVPLVATNDAYFIEKDMHEAHDAFLCISDGTYVAEQNRRHLTPQHRLREPEEMVQLFADIPEAVANTVHIARRCSFFPDGRAPMLPKYASEGLSEADTLRKQAMDGLQQRLLKHVYTQDMDVQAQHDAAQPYIERLNFELDVIIKMQFPGYFLIVSDFIRWSKDHGIPVGPGRGSGAGSLVAWALQITDLDPLRYSLLFERFLNPERVSMPDFDVDFCQDRREEVIRYVQGKYGTDHVAQIITFGKLQARAVLRDVGRVLQMPYGQVDRICKLVPNNPANPVTLAEAIKMEPMLKAAIREDETVAKLASISLKLEGLNRHASTHAAGVVIADRPLDELVPMYRDPKSDMPVVQYSMKYAEAAGLVKFDFLGLKTLTVLSRTVGLLRDRGIEIDLQALPEGDIATYALLSRGETVGVFQLESAGMRDTLKKLKPDCLEDIIALVSLYRPGPMDNIPTYIARKHGREKAQYLHPLLEQVLKETFGVIIYQEQVMQIAQLLAGYSLGEADLLRRAMGKKIKEEMEAQRGIFIERSVDRGVEKDDAESIFELIAKFAAYGFNKSHAAAYALIAYQTAFLKANHPVEFLAASMTYDMHNTDKLGIFREDAAQLGIEMLPPDINASEVLFSVENGAIRYALSAVRNVGEQAMHGLVAERRSNGLFRDIFDCMTRIPAESLNKRAMEYLIKAGAFDRLHGNRKQLFDHLDMLLAHGLSSQRDRDSSQSSLFAGESALANNKPRLAEGADWNSLERLEHEFSAIGFYLSSHPLSDYQNALQSMRVTSSADLAAKLGMAYGPLRVAGIVTGKKFKVSDKGRFAFLQLSDMGGVFEVSIFNEVLLNEQRDLLENGKILFIQAEGKLDENGPRLIANSIRLFDDAFNDQPAMNMRGQLRIVISEPQAVASIRSLLGDGNGSGMVVRLTARADGKDADIDLPGKYTVSPGLLDKIRSVQGVDEASEVAA
ncbi:MAG: DNA polymerase III subunit alpha [Alphaproteobacteria bacterium]